VPKFSPVTVPNPETNPAGFDAAIAANMAALTSAVENAVFRTGDTLGEGGALDLSGQRVMNGYIYTVEPEPEGVVPNFLDHSFGLVSGSTFANIDVFLYMPTGDIGSLGASLGGSGDTNTVDGEAFAESAWYAPGDEPFILNGQEFDNSAYEIRIDYANSSGSQVPTGPGVGEWVPLDFGTTSFTYSTGTVTSPEVYESIWTVRVRDRVTLTELDTADWTISVSFGA
jgi:hypothetical protein